DSSRSCPLSSRTRPAFPSRWSAWRGAGAPHHRDHAVSRHEDDILARTSADGDGRPSMSRAVSREFGAHNHTMNPTAPSLRSAAAGYRARYAASDGTQKWVLILSA